MQRAIYTLVLYLLAPLVWMWMGHRARKAGGMWGILSRARFGGVDGSTPDPFVLAPVWVHAVSLGETRAAQPLISDLLQQGHSILLTHTTATGRAEGARLFAEAIASGQLRQTWLPYDFPGSTRRFLGRYKPCCGLLIEREVWPNLIEQARVQGIRMALVSARFSASSLRQAKWMGAVLRNALASLDLVLAQTHEDAQRLTEAGARHVSVTGNVKFDLELPAHQRSEGQAWHRALGRPVIAIASTREGEDDLFVQAIRALRHRIVPEGSHTVTQDDASPLYIVIPRHPHRFDEIEQQLHTAGLTYIRRSHIQGAITPAVAQQLDVVVGDSLGEMAFYYAIADVAIVAGSFLPFGGQNLIEACASGIPVIVGPHTFNFKQAATDAIAAGGVIRAADISQALDIACGLLRDPPSRLAMGQAASEWAVAHAGATKRTLQVLDSWLDMP